MLSDSPGTVCLRCRLWIKGREFTLEALLDDRKLAQYYAGGSLAIFRFGAPGRSG